MCACKLKFEPHGAPKNASNYHMKARTVCIGLLLGIPFMLTGQAQLGLRTGNYAGVNGWALNPSAHTATPFNWEVNLLEGAFFFDNNYSFLQNTSLLDLAKRGKNLEIAFGPDFDEENPPPAGSVVLDFYDDNRNRYGNADISIGGPAFFVRLGEQHAVGLFTRARAFASGRNVVNALSYYRYYDRPYLEPFQVTPFKMSIASWSELGLNYLFQTTTDAGKLGLAISARYLQPYEGIYFHNSTEFALSKLPGDTLTGGPIHFEYGHTNSNLQQAGRRITPNGAGAAIDIGATLIIGEENDYTWRLGFSLLDIGRLQFSRNARMHRVSPNTTSTIGFQDYKVFEMPHEFEDMLSLFSEQTLGDPETSSVGDRFGMWLPAAVSFQADRNLGGGFFLNAVILHGIPLGGSGAMWRGSLVALTPRIEKRWIEFALPVSLYHGNRLQVGLAGRLGFLTLGTDRLGSIFTNSNLSGTDFYFALKLQPFRLQSASSDKDPRRSNGLRGQKAARAKAGKGNVRCYKF